MNCENEYDAEEFSYLDVLRSVVGIVDKVSEGLHWGCFARLRMAGGWGYMRRLEESITDLGGYSV